MGKMWKILRFLSQALLLVPSVARDAVVNGEGAKLNARNHSTAHHETTTNTPSCTAENIHVAPASSVRLDNNTVDMWISFTLDYKDCRQHLQNQTVIAYGTCGSPESTSILPGERIQFSFAEHFYRVHESSWIYHTKLQNLTTSECYWYQIVVNDNRRAAAYSFKTPPSLQTPTSLAFVGDWGQSEDALKTMLVLMEDLGNVGNNVIDTYHNNPALAVARRSLRKTSSSSTSSSSPPPLSALMVVGDLSYANGHLPSWESWLSAMQPLFSRLPLLIAPGNHELECDARSYKIFQAYQHYFRTPNYREVSEWQPVPVKERFSSSCTHTAQETWSVYESGNSYYQYRHGLAHMIVLNSYTSTKVGSSPQYKFLEQTLQHDFDRSITPWLIVVFHCPFHTTFIGHNDEINPTLMQQNFGPLFDKYGVNLIVNGHQHAYVRSHPMDHHHNTIQKNGTVHLTVGTGGESHAKGYRHDNKPEAFVAASDHTTFGAGKLQLFNKTHAYWERLLISDSHNAILQDGTWFVNHHAV